MIKNLKIDIIYYNTPSDFEFEFNLGGYCRSRILNAKAATLKEMIGKLAIAVTRSRVVIIVGELLGENGCIMPVAKSIGKKLVNIDHRKYHITTPETISVVEDSLPLVSDSGDFGGCIIESGPQSIIMLTQNKTLRSKISHDLLSFYLTSLSRVPDTENDIIDEDSTVKDDTAENEQNIGEREQDIFFEGQTQEVVTEEETIAEDEITLLEAQPEDSIKLNEIDEHEVTEILNATKETEEFVNLEEEENCEDDLILSVSQENEQIFIPDDDEEEEKYDIISFEEQHEPIMSDNDVPTELENSFAKSSFKSSKKAKNKNSTLSTILIVLFIVLLLIIAALLYFVVYLPRLDGIDTIDYIREVFAFDGVRRFLYLKI